MHKLAPCLASKMEVKTLSDNLSNVEAEEEVLTFA